MKGSHYLTATAWPALEEGTGRIDDNSGKGKIAHLNVQF